MSAVAIEAPLGSCVLSVARRDLGVAGGAGLCDDRRFAMKLVALRALGRGVHSDRGERALCLGVARDARGCLLFGPEDMTGEAIGLGLCVPAMGMRDLVRVTL